MFIGETTKTTPAPLTQDIKDLTLLELIQLKGDIEKSIEAYKPPKKRIILREDKIIIYFPYDRDEVKKIKRIEPLGKFNGSVFFCF